MALPKVMNGARGQVFVGNKLIGLLDSISWNVSYDAADAYILGRTGPAAIEYTAMEPVTGSMSGWSVVKNGPHIVGLPALQNLLTDDYTHIVVYDRVSDTRIGIIQGTRLLGSGRGLSARQLSQVSLPFKAMLCSDESQENGESKGASDLNIS